MSAQTPTKKDYGSSTKDLNRVLGVKELMGIAIGQIIGAGIMSMMGIAINYTGRSANLAVHALGSIHNVYILPLDLHLQLYPNERRPVYSVRYLRW